YQVFFSSRRRHTRFSRDWSSDVCSSDLALLDVTKIEPRLKHPTIFDHFDALAEGEAFEILNDHDPKPLYYQLLGERGNYFTWEYLESGPEWWRVRIAKPAAVSEDTVGSIAAKDIRKIGRAS